MAKPEKRTNFSGKRINGRLVMGIALVAIPIAIIATGVSLLIDALAGKTLNTANKADFSRQMPVPALASSTVASDGTRTFNLNMQTGSTNFFDDAPTSTWGINGNYLGPTLRAKRGEKVKINVTNSLSEQSSVHWHGMHLPARMDGGPHQPIEVGQTWSPNWQIDQPAATLWYHPHPHGSTEPHVYRGLAGMFILDDDTMPSSIPHNYGSDDLPVIVQDKNFTADRQLSASSDGPTGKIGNEIIVNGALTPHVNVTTQKVRLRLLNGSTARIYNFGLSSGDNMQLIATDGGLLEQPVATSRVALSPGERAEVIVSLQPGESTTLRSYPINLDAGFIAERRIGAGDTLDILQLRAAQALSTSPDLPAQLTKIEQLKERDAAATRDFVLDTDFTINGKSMDMNRIDFSVTKGSTEVWNVKNLGGSPHSFHVHGVQFRVLSMGKAIAPELMGSKDTVLIPEGQTAKLIIRFNNNSDPSFPYMYHCHLIRHEDKGMMGQFVVIDPGATAPKELPASEHSHAGMR